MFVFPMAGLSSRFTKAGFTKPKYMLDAGGRSLFWHAVSGFRRYFDTHDFLFVMRDIQDTPAFVAQECARMGLQAPKMVVLDAPTSGQAETVAAGLRQAGYDPDMPLTIFNIDTIRRHFTLPDAFDLNKIDGYLEVFNTPGDHWSFVRPAEAPDGTQSGVSEVTEKKRISDLCSTGLYHFKSARLFLDAYSGIENRDPAELQGGERYVAPLYNTLLAAGKDIRYITIGPDDVAFSGTPDEYETFKTQIPARPRTAAIVTGKLRHIGEAFETLGKAVSLRDEGLLSSVVLSTWRGEIDQFPRLREQLLDAGITLVESDVPSLTIRPSAMWLTWLQATQLQRGIEAAGDADCIFKLRTDKCAPLIEQFRPALQDMPLPAGPFSPLDGVITTRLARAAIPLHVNDIIYFGLRTDLERLVRAATNGRLEYESKDSWTGIETRWAAGVFFEDSALFRSYHASVDAFAAARALLAWGESRNDQPPPPALLRVLAYGWRAFADGFKIVGGQPGPEMPAVTVESALDPTDRGTAFTIQSRRGALRNFNNQTVIDALARGHVADSPLAASCMTAQAELDAGAADTPLTGDEFDTIRAFLEAHGEAGTAVQRWLDVTYPRADGHGFAGADSFSGAEALAFVCRRSGAPESHVDPVVRIASRHRGKRPGSDSHAVANAYLAGTEALPEDPALALYWLWIGAELRHEPSVIAYAEAALRDGTDRELMTRALAQLDLSGLQAGALRKALAERIG